MCSVITRFFVFVHERGLILSVATRTHLFLWCEGVYSRLAPARGARNKEIARHRVRSCQAPQMPSVHTHKGCRLCYCVSVRLFFHFQCSDSGLAMQLTCISVLKDSSINPDRKICRRYLASENALLPQWWRLEVGSIKKKRLWQFSSPSLFHFLPIDQESPLPVAVSLRDVSRLPLARYGRSCSSICLRPRLCWAARSVSICCHSRMLALGLRLDLPVSGGLVEDDHHARGLEDDVFRHFVAVTAHVTFVHRCHTPSIRALPSISATYWRQR